MNQKKDLSEFHNELKELAHSHFRALNLKPDEQLERLLGNKFYNPYDVLLLEHDATDSQIQKQYRNFAHILHPDKNKHPRTKDAFQMCKQAVDTLRNSEKRNVYIRVMRQGWQRASHERNRQNQRRAKQGLSKLPQQTFDAQYRKTYLKIFEELEQKRKHLEKIRENNYKAKLEEAQNSKLVEQFRILTEDDWDKTRDHRVSNWRKFMTNRPLVGTKQSNGGIRPPVYRAEQKLEGRVHDKKI